MDNLNEQVENALKTFEKSRVAIKSLPLDHPKKVEILGLLKQIEQAAKSGDEKKLNELKFKIQNVSN